MMNRLLLGAPLALLFLAVIAPSQAQTAAEADVPVVVVVRAGAAWELACPLRVEAAAQWRRVDEEGAPPPPASLRRGERPEARGGGGGVLATLSAPHARAHHAGLYECGPAPDQRLRLRVLPALPAALPALPVAAGSRALGEADESVVYYDIYKKFQLNCSLPNPEPRNEVLWFKNDTLVSAVPELRGRYRAEGDTFALTAKSTEEDYGLYACAIQPGAAASADQLAQAPRQTFEVRGRAHSKLPADSNVVEEQTLKLVCKVAGKPTETVTWHYRAELDGNETTVQERFGDRVNTTQVNATATLTLKEAVRADAGFYSCNVTGISGATQVRVKDMYAALWPFLGICAEVFVLCAIILVYERRRTKPELDDSDTDNHDQKKS